MRAADVLTLAAVALVVLLVSLPRLRDLALRENESDALWLTRRLSELATAREPRSVQELLEAAPDLRRQIDDAQYLEGGRLLRRHGYAFEVLEQPGAAQGSLAVRAWPWRAGRTGGAAFVWTASGGLLGSANRAGRWSGEQAPPTEVGAAGEWAPVAGH
jgi:hypothetical protein